MAAILFFKFDPLRTKFEIANIDFWIQRPQIRLKKYVGKHYPKMPVEVWNFHYRSCL